MDSSLSKSEEALLRLKNGNVKYTISGFFTGEIGERIRKETFENGQKPFAVVISCSDSRVLPEVLFSCGIGDLFVIRVAGNVALDTEMASIDYCVNHLGVSLAVVLGHTNCGAVKAALKGHNNGLVARITSDIQKGIGREQDYCSASKLNVKYQAEKLREAFPSIKVAEAMYDINTGCVSWL